MSDNINMCVNSDWIMATLSRHLPPLTVSNKSCHSMSSVNRRQHLLSQLAVGTHCRKWLSPPTIVTQFTIATHYYCCKSLSLLTVATNCPNYCHNWILPLSTFYLFHLCPSRTFFTHLALLPGLPPQNMVCRRRYKNFDYDKKGRFTLDTQLARIDAM